MKSGKQQPESPLSADKPAVSLWVIGLMSGTSADGIDAALIQTDGESIRLQPRKTNGSYSLCQPWPLATRDRIFRAMAELADLPADATRESAMAMLAANCELSSLATEIADQHAAAVEQLISKTGTTPALLGFHGQTVVHRPARAGSGFTIQLGDAQHLANRLGLPVVHDFRRQDIEAGGQGAPLAPVYHRALLRNLVQNRSISLPAGFVNIGGITNITWWDGQRLIGMDTGPGNALMDRLASLHLGLAMDEDGRLAASGTPDQQYVSRLLDDEPYFTKPAPKSLDRMAMEQQLLQHLPDRLTLADRFASLALLTVKATLHSLALLPAMPKALVLSGGGARNPHLVQLFQQCLKNWKNPPNLMLADTLQLDGEAMEAELIAFLARRNQRQMPISFPETTGISTPMTGGTLVLPG